MARPKSTAKADITIIRRERVSALLLRGLTQREIEAALAGDDKHPGLLNPDTRKPYDLATINRDIKVLREQHREAASAQITEHQARQFAELQELKRFAWSSKDGRLALSALEKEMKLLGTQRQPDGLQLNFNIELVIRVVDALTAAGIDPVETFEKMVQKASERVAVDR